MSEPRSEPQSQRARKRSGLRWILEILLVACLVIAVHAYRTRGVAEGAAPAFQGQLLDGTPVSMHGFRGQPLLLHFWASWCPVCALQQTSIEDLCREAVRFEVERVHPGAPMYFI